MDQPQIASTLGIDIAYYDIGPKDGPTAVLMHGFPYDPRAYREVARLLAAQGVRIIVPYLRGFGPTTLAANAIRSGQQAALGADLKALMDALELDRPVLAGFDWGGRAACIAAALWPDAVRGLVSCGVGYNIQNIATAHQPSSPEEEARYWYIYLLQTQRGAEAFGAARHSFCLDLWTRWSPRGEGATKAYAASALSFDNPDFTAITLSSYRHRLDNAPGDPAFDALEARLAAQPIITVPTIVLQGTDDTVDPPGPIHEDGFAKLQGIEVLDRVGHNPPQEAPEPFASAVLRLL